MAGRGGESRSAIGIDLGTTYSCVGVLRKGRVEIITSDQGNRTTPSCVAFTDHERLIGEGALSQAFRNPTNTVFDAKRLIGRRYSEECVQTDMKSWPFKVVGDNEKPKVVVQYKGEQIQLSPEQISSMILLKMKKNTEIFLGYEVSKAVVTVPAYFNNVQRQATVNAGTLAGLDVMQVLNEPTAAALGYSFHNKGIVEHHKDGKKKRILVFDLGGGTFDVSLLELDKNGTLEVKATAGDTHLGGQDFDNRMVDHLVDVIKKKYRKDVKENAKCITRLKMECEKAKRVLSTATVTEINLDCLFDGIDFSRSFTRFKFEQLNSDLFERCLGPLKQCLDDARVKTTDVDEVVLVGGSTRIPKIQEMLQGFFHGKKLNNQINADEAVAYGASIHASSLSGNKDQERPDVALLDVTSLSFGMADYRGIMYIAIPRNTRIPCRVNQVWYTDSDNQLMVPFKIYEGERSVAADNNFLGKIEHVVRPAPRGSIEFVAVYEINENGILNFTVTNMDNGHADTITIGRDMLTLDKEDIDKMIRDARRFEFDDQERKRAICAKKELEEYKEKLTRLIGESRVASKIDKGSGQFLAHEIMELNEWIEENDNATCDEYVGQKEFLEKKWEPIRISLEKMGLKNLRI